MLVLYAQERGHCDAAVMKTEKYASPETGGRRRSVLAWATRGLGAGDEEVGGVGFRSSGNDALGGWQPDCLA